MNSQTCETAGTPPACQKKSTELFYVAYPKAPKASLRPFVTKADAECDRLVIRSADAVVTACLIDSLDDLPYWHAVNNGKICLTFTGADCREVRNG